MKKLMLTAILLVAMGSLLSAQSPGPRNSKAGTNKEAANYTDANNNSVCDNYENRAISRPFLKKGKGQGRRAATAERGQKNRCFTRQGRGNAGRNR